MSKDYLKVYGTQNKVGKFQMGGEMAPEAAAPEMAEAPTQQGPDIEGMLMQYAETRDPQIAVAICDMLLEMMGGAQEAQPAMRNGGRMNYETPVFRKGGKLL
jgi:hypothetical protein